MGVRSADAVKARPDRGILEIRLARIERLAGQYRRASAHISLALELLAEGELIKELADAHLENCLLHEERQHHRAALDSHRQFAALRERLLVAQSDARAHALTTRFEFELAQLRPTDAAARYARVCAIPLAVSPGSYPSDEIPLRRRPRRILKLASRSVPIPGDTHRQSRTHVSPSP